jgi:dihydroorotate dehydrogenase
VGSCRFGLRPLRLPLTLHPQAGADAIELNAFFIPADPLDGRQVEQRYIDVLQAVKQAVHIPVAMKLNRSSARSAISFASSTELGLTVLFFSTASTSPTSISSRSNSGATWR